MKREEEREGEGGREISFFSQGDDFSLLGDGKDGAKTKGILGLCLGSIPNGSTNFLMDNRSVSSVNILPFTDTSCTNLPS